MLGADDIHGEYVRLRADSPACSLDTQDTALSSSEPGGINLPTTTPSTHYVPKRSGKYQPAWKSLIPFKRTKRAVYEVPLDNLGLFSYITSSWMTSFLRKSWNPSLSEQELVTGPSSDSSDINGQRFKLILSDEIVKSGVLNSSLKRVVWHFIRTRILIAAALSLIGSIITILALILLLLPYFLTLKEKDSIFSSAIWIFPLVFILVHIIAIFFESWSTNITHRTAVRLRSSFLTTMYKHLIRVSVLSSISAQQIVTAMATDSQRLFQAVTCVPGVITSVIVFTICSLIMTGIYMIALFQHPPCGTEYVRMAVINVTAGFFVFPLMYMLAQVASILKSRGSTAGAERLVKLHEMLLHMRLVKMMSWENQFTNKIEGFRRMECKLVTIAHIVEGFGILLVHAIPAITAMVFCYINISSTMYIIIIILLLVPIKDSLHKFWVGVNEIASAQESLERMRCILLLEKSKQANQKPVNRLVAVTVTNASFVLKPSSVVSSWMYNTESCFSCRRCSARSYQEERDDMLEMQVKSLLTNITFSAPKGKLIGICGASGSGKTTLLLAMLGHLNLGYGKVSREGMFSYVSQNPWIWDATLRDNILFGEVFSHKRYYQAIHCCSLNDDIQHLPGGDQTKLNARSLSLGMRQRVAVARALYAKRDICLFDEFLSGLDEKLASEIFDKAILTHLKEKTVIITSQQMKFLSCCDEIFLLDKGEVIGRGSYQELITTTEEEFTSILKKTDEDLYERNFHNPQQFTITPNPNTTLNMIPSVMIEDDDQDTTEISLMEQFSSSMWMVYIRRKSQTLLCLINSVILRALFMIMVFGSAVCCTFMLSNSYELEFSTIMYWIPATILLTFVFGICGSCIFYKALQEISLTVHKKWFAQICRTSVVFFEESWAADIQKWFSQYLQDIDSTLLLGGATAVQQFILVLLAVLVIITTSTWLLLPLVVMLILCLVLSSKFQPGLIKLKRLEEESCNPMYSFVASTLSGRATIQAYGKENDYLTMFVKHCDVSGACSQLVSGALCWLNFRIQIISVLAMALILGLMVIAQIFQFQEFLFVLSPFEEAVSEVEIIMLCILVLANALSYTMQSSVMVKTKYALLCQLDTRVRMMEPINCSSISSNLPANWPTDGSIVFKNVKVKMWPHSSSTPNGMTFMIQPNEKVGIVTLPGAHHLSIVDILYRLVDLSHGSVYIGGTDISTVPLDKLRSSIALIPLSPVLFSGSIRHNIDPQEEFLPSELQDSLEKVSLWEVIRELPNKLDTKVEFLRDKLSEYEHQLIYVARAILKDPKVIIVEESISSSDISNFTKIHAVVKKLFTSSTVLIVAHNVLSVLECHRVAVIKDGQMIEFGTPQQLFKNSKSRFSKMLSASTNNLFETPL